MNRIPLIILVSLFSCPFIFAQDQGTNSLPLIRAKNADIFYNQTALVTGKVAQVTFRSNVVFLNLEEPYPNSPFTGVIFKKDTNQFSGLEKLKGQSVGITGFVKQYDNKPEIVMTNASQLRVLELDKK